MEDARGSELLPDVAAARNGGHRLDHDLAALFLGELRGFLDGADLLTI